jgi:threonylcarbamoyladenosine tRNA methylthiotransferase MtaB
LPTGLGPLKTTFLRPEVFGRGGNVVRTSLHTLGCRLNQAESALLADAFRSHGYEVVGEREDADLVVINTCSVTRGSEAKCRRLIRFLKKRSPSARVVVTGCYAQLEPERLAQIEGVDLLVGNGEKHRIPELVHRFQPRDEPVVRRERIGRGSFSIAQTGLYRETRANLKIQDGCDVFCSFCVIPFTRGRARSRDLEDTLREARDLVRRGHKEIVLSGVNIGTFRDGDADFCALLDRLEEIPRLERIRISSIEPMSVGAGLVDRLERSEKLCPYIHLCLQSADDGVLEAMNRPYTASRYRDLFEEIFRRVSGVGIGTDVLVGFPGESDQAFHRTYDLLKELPFYHFHVFAYSEHPRTGSARMGGKVPPEVIKERSEKVRALGREKKIGRCLEVLFETRGEDGRWTGHAPNYIRVAVSHNGDLANRVAPVLIEEARENEAVGVLAEAPR